MNCHKITYCNSNGFLVKNNRAKFNIIDNIKNSLHYDILNLYNKNYSDRLLSTIKKNKLICTYITGGKYVYMYLTRIYNENMCLIIELEKNKENKFPKIISIPCNFSDSLFVNNTLFLGEVYRDYKNKWFFLIESIEMYENRKFNKGLFESVKKINSILKDDYKYTELSPFVIKVKKFFRQNKIRENIDQLQINMKGIKFLGLKNPICFYFVTKNYNNSKNTIDTLPNIRHDLTSEKTKIIDEYQQESEIDIEIISLYLDYTEKIFILELRKTNIYGIYDVYANNNNVLKTVGNARIDSIEMSTKLLELTDQSKELIVKARLDKDFKKFTILEILERGVISNYNTVKSELDLIYKFPLPKYIDN